MLDPCSQAVKGVLQTPEAMLWYMVYSDVFWLTVLLLGWLYKIANLVNGLSHRPLEHEFTAEQKSELLPNASAH